MAVFFFFQAEDGIRDVAVTGVQTCALPISCRGPRYRSARRAPGRRRPGRSGRAASPSSGVRTLDPVERPLRGASDLEVRVAERAPERRDGVPVATVAEDERGVPQGPARFVRVRALPRKLARKASPS